MANGELNETFLKNLETRLQNLDKVLVSAYDDTGNLKKMLTSLGKEGGMSLKEIESAYSFLKTKVSDLKFKVILDGTDAKRSISELKQNVEGLREAANSARGADRISAIEKYKQAVAELAVARMSEKEQLEYILNIIHKINVEQSKGKSAKGTTYGQAQGHVIEDVRKAREEIIKLQERQRSLQEAINRAEQNTSGQAAWNGKRRSIEYLNKELDNTNNLIAKQNAILQSGGRRGEATARALGLSSQSDNDNIKQLIAEARELAKEKQRLDKVAQQDAKWQEQQRKNTEAQFIANGKAIEQQRKLADQIDVLIRKREELVKYRDGSTVAFDSRNYPLATAYQKQIDDLRKMREQIERQFEGSMKAGDLAFADTKTLRDNEEVQRRITAEQKRIDKERAASAKERAAIERKADSESIANQRRQIQIKAQLSAIDKARNSDSDILSKRAKAQIAEENAEYKRLSAELTRLIARQKELNAISQGSGSRARGRLQTYEIVASEQALRRYEEAWRRVNREQKQSDDNMKSMLSTVSRLASAFGVAFSVQGLVQFGKKLVETRGEFEMQFVAMKSIIGDVDAATRIWNQTLQQSLQSPKTFKELTKYTKQLAAYRIETDKLYETTKRLADVSAGLGVDMGRLILAYGQVKAANYLRASEVRQFTEAGVNIYGELARYFSEIEGRAVGTAEVVERVTKRMVLFSDVEKIFQRMTDEGGTFFNMQEIQADTVLGQINKLHDAYDQMLNTIGQSKQGAIRYLLDTLNDLVRNWQNVAFVLKGNVNWITIIGAALYALSRNYLKGATTQTLWFSKAIMGNSKALLKNTEDVRIFSRAIGDYTLKQRLAIVATRTLQGALSKLWSVAKAALPFLVFEGAVILIERLTRASRELKRFREELESVTSENVGKMNEEISGYDALVKKLQKTNEGTAARKEILDEISSKYGKYLDFIVTEKTTVEELAGAYDNVVSSIRNYTAEKIREEQQQKLEKGIYNEYQDLVDSLTGKRIADAQGNQFKITKEQAKNIAKLIQQSLDVYGVVDIQQILETYFGKALGLTSAGGGNTGIGNLIRSYIGEYNSLKSELQEIRNDIEGETPVFSSDAEYNDYLKRVQAANAALAEQAKKNEQIIDSIKKKTRTESDSWKIEDEISAQRIKNSEEELRIRKKYGLLTEQQYKDALKRLNGELDSYETDYNARLAKALSDQYGKTWKTSNKEARDMYNYVVSTEDALQQGTLQRNKQLVESYKGLKESLKEYKEQLSAAQKTGAGEDAVKKIQSDIDWTTLMMKAIELAAQLRGLDLTDKGKSRTAHNYDSISSLISLLKEMNSEYDKLSKSAYGFAKSNEKVVESFTPAFKEIFGFAGIDISQVDTTSKRATADAMKLVIDTLDKKNLWGKFGSDGGKKARKEFVKAWSQENVEADIDVQVRIREDFGRQMEEAIGNYELTLELQKLNLPKGLAADMWGIEEVDLSQLRGKLDELFQGLKDANGEVAADSLKAYEGYLKKIDDLEQKQQRERLKDYAKYIEAQYSDRVKLEMDYVRKVAKLEAETAISPEQRAAIRAGIDKEYNEAVKKQDWEDFKGSEFYVQMMEDLEKQGTASLEVMREKLEEMRKNAENLTPRALKEVVNSLEKIDEIERGRTAPLQRLKKALDDLGDTNMSEVYKSLAANQKQLSVQEEQKRQLEEMIMLENERNRLKDEGINLDEITSDVANAQLRAAEDLLRLTNIRYNEFKSDGSKESNQQLQGLLEQVNQQKAIVELWQKIVQMLAGNQTIEDIGKDNPYMGMSISDLNNAKEALEEQIKNTNNNISAQQELVRIAKALQQAWYDTFESIKDYAQRIGGIFDGVTETIDYFADSTNSLAAEWREFGNTAVSALSDLVSGIQAYEDAKAKAEKGDAAAGLMSGNVLKLALVILGVIIKIIQAVAKFNDSAIDKEIERSRQRVDELSRAYERLEKSIERTFKTADYMANYNEQMQNLREQLAAAEAQISAASQYKDEDKKRDALNSARDAKDQVLDMMDEIEQRQLETFGGIGKDNYRSWAEGFVDAWKDAFLETGDGLDALQDHFDEFLQEWFVKQATMRIAGKALEGVMGDIDKVVSDNGVVDWAELQRIKDQMDLILPDLNDKLTAFAGMWDFGGEGGLSGLAAGIQGMTEEQANILEAYWNSVRMYTASIDGNVSRIAEMLGANGVESNPMLQQMSLIAANTQATHQLLQTVVKSGHPQGGYGIKVFND